MKDKEWIIAWLSMISILLVAEVLITSFHSKSTDNNINALNSNINNHIDEENAINSYFEGSLYNLNTTINNQKNSFERSLEYYKIENTGNFFSMWANSLTEMETTRLTNIIVSRNLLDKVGCAFNTSSFEVYQGSFVFYIYNNNTNKELEFTRTNITCYEGWREINCQNLCVPS